MYYMDSPKMDIVTDLLIKVEHSHKYGVNFTELM